MTITSTSTHHALMVAWARHDIEALTGPTPSRECAGRVLREWHSYGAMTGAEIADVLAAYLPEEPETVAGRDYLAESKPQRGRWRDKDEYVWVQRQDGLIALELNPGGNTSSLFVYAELADVESDWGPLVEVTDEPTAVAS